MAVPGTSDDVIEVKRTFEPRLEWDSGVRNYLSQAYGAAKFQDICTALWYVPGSCVVKFLEWELNFCSNSRRMQTPSPMLRSSMFLVLFVWL